MEEINYVEYMPTKPPKAVFDYINSKKRFTGHDVLIYRKEWIYNPIEQKKCHMVRVKCSCCGAIMYYEEILPGCSRYATAPYGFKMGNEVLGPGDCALCPECGAECKVMHVGQLNNRYRNEVLKTIYPMHIAIIRGRAALVSWKISLVVNKESEKKIKASPYEAYVFEDNKVIKLKGWYKYFSTLVFLEKWEQKKTYFDEYGECDDFVPFMPYELEGTALENAKLDLYLKSKGKRYPVSYAYMYLKRKTVENLVMQGAGYLLSEMISKESITGYGYYKGESITKYNTYIQFKKKRPCEMLGLTKEEFRYFVRKHTNLELIQYYKSARMSQCNIQKEDIPEIGKEGVYSTEELSEFNKDISKCLRYIKKQREKTAEYKSAIGFTMLKDYYAMLIDENTKLDKDNLYPQNLYKSHNDAVERLEFRKDKAKMKLFAARYKILKALQFEDEETGLIIIPCKKECELRNEGKVLHHCVASYADAHSKGKTNIFFIRKQSKITEPFFTVELKERNGEFVVIQNRGKHNCSRTEIVIEFEKKWLEHIEKLEVI